jgi:hypothetical protein
MKSSVEDFLQVSLAIFGVQQDSIGQLLDALTQVSD